MLTWLQRNKLEFPPLEKAMREPNGLLAAGGDLSPDRLIQAYRHGCFLGFRRVSRSFGGRRIHARYCCPMNFTYPKVSANCCVNNAIK